MNRYKKRLLCLMAILLVSVAAACGGAGGERNPVAYFRSLLADQEAVIGQFVLFKAVFANVHATSTWTLFTDNDTDYDNGATPFADGTGDTVLDCWDSSGSTDGSRVYFGVVVTVDGKVWVFYAPGSILMAAAALPVVAIEKPDAYAQYEIGTPINIRATVDNWTEYRWYFSGTLIDTPLNPIIDIANFPASSVKDFNWNTTGLSPASYYICAAVMKGDIFSFAITDFLITLTKRDFWVPMSKVDAPEARYEHKAVWTGTRFITWGGRGRAGYLLSGRFMDTDLNRQLSD